MSIEQLFYLSDLFGVAVFAITGALMAGRKSMDLFGVLVIAIITALGGGTLRDLILDNHPVSWIRNDLYILVASLSAVGTVLWVRRAQLSVVVGASNSSRLGMRSWRFT